MDEDYVQIQVSLDSTSAGLRNIGEINQYKDVRRKDLERNLDGMVRRHKTLPPYVIAQGSYSDLLKEARQLYIEGKDYSCVAMCGITAERIAKDILCTLVKFHYDGKSNYANEKQAKYLFKIAFTDVSHLLYESKMIDNEVKKAFIKIGNLRNIYAHGSGEDKENDSKEAIKNLHKIIDGTISLYKHFKLEEGKFVKKKNN